MKTAQEWRWDYYTRRGRMIEPCSFLDDVLKDLEELEASILYLQARLLDEDPMLTPKEMAP